MKFEKVDCVTRTLVKVVQKYLRYIYTKSCMGFSFVFYKSLTQ